MKTIGKFVIVGALAAALLVPATASASPFLSGREARQQIGGSLHRKAEYGAVTGSLRARCYGIGRSIVRCAISFEDWDGDYWCGYARVRETWATYYIRWNVRPC